MDQLDFHHGDTSPLPPLFIQTLLLSFPLSAAATMRKVRVYKREREIEKGKKGEKREIGRGKGREKERKKEGEIERE